MKEITFEIENLKRAREALNAALTQAMVMMSQKGVGQATVGLTIDLELDETNAGQALGISYKTSVRVPLDIKQAGKEENCRQVYWDQDRLCYMMRVDGEQVTMDGVEK